MQHSLRRATALGALTALSLQAQEPAAHRVDALDLDGARFVRREVLVNTFRASSQQAASIAVAPDGFVVAWDSRRQRGGISGVCAQRYDAAGWRVGDEIALRDAGANHQHTPAVTVSADGALWLAWESEGRTSSCRLERAGDDAAARELGHGERHRVALATLHDGTLVAAWVRTDRFGREHAEFGRFDAAGAPLGSPRAVAVGPCLDGGNLPCVAALADGGFALAWQALDGTRRPDGLRVQAFDADGTPRAAARTFGRAPLAGSIEPALAARDDGLVLAWMDNEASRAHHDVLAQRLDASAAPVGEPFVVARAERHQSGAHVATARDGSGRFCIAWNVAEDGDASDDVHARLYARDGTPLGDAFAVTAHSAGHQALLAANNKTSVAFGAHGQLAFAWSGDGGLGDESGVHLTLLVPAGLALAARAAETRADLPRLACSDAAEIPDLGARVVAERTAPHDPPVYEEVRERLPNGGDLNPTGGIDSGFIGITNTGWSPPDCHLAAGPNHLVAIVNGGIAFLTKTGTQTFFQTISGGGGFWGSLGATSFVFDPRAVFDPHSGRFVVMAVERTDSSGNSGQSLWVVGVSDDDDPNGTWFKYRIDVTAASGSGGIDFPHLGVTQDAVILTANVFNGGGPHLVTVLPKQPMLSGQPVTPFNLRQSTATSACTGIHWESTATPYMLRTNGGNGLTLIAIRNPLTAPALVTFNIAVPAFSSPARAPQVGTTNTLWTVDNRIWQCQYRNGRLWAVHHHGSPCRGRFYEIDVRGWPNGGSPVLVQSGDLNAGTGISSFFPGIAVDRYGNAFIGFARSSPNERTSIQRAYRRAGDPLGVLQDYQIVKTSDATYTPSHQRWGDYSAVAADPNDNVTFWYYHEYAPTSSSWNTWVAHRRVQGPTLVADRTSISASAGGPIRFTLDNPSHGSRRYYLLGSFSGSSPAFRLPSPLGYVFLNLVFDPLTDVTVLSANSALFQNNFGTLDASGRATAVFNLPPVPVLAGRVMTFAYAQDGRTWDFASDAVAIAITP